MSLTFSEISESGSAGSCAWSIQHGCPQWQSWSIEILLSNLSRFSIIYQWHVVHYLIKGFLVLLLKQSTKLAAFPYVITISIEGLHQDKLHDSILTQMIASQRLDLFKKEQQTLLILTHTQPFCSHSHVRTGEAIWCLVLLGYQLSVMIILKLIKLP